MPNYYSNDGLIYDTLSHGSGVKAARKDFMDAMHFDGINVEFEDDYIPIITFTAGQWSDKLDPNSKFYQQVILHLTFEYFHFLKSAQASKKILRVTYHGRWTLREALQGKLTLCKKEYGSRHYLTIFIDALLTKTDFAENEDFVMPIYCYRN